MMNKDIANAALDANDILKNHGGLINNDLIYISNLNADQFEQNTMSTKQSLYYDIDGIVSFLKGQKNNFSVLSLNIQSLNSKFNELCSFIQILNNNSVYFDVICLQESWLSDKDNYNIFKINDYNLYKKDFEENCSTHGGLVVYIRKEICVSKVEPIFNKYTYEGMVVTVKTQNNKKVKLINIYRPPRDSFDDFINDYIPTISDKIKDANEVIITGDFNINLLNIMNSRKTCSFYDHMLNFHLFPAITFPTHFLDKTCTLIDNIFTKFATASQSLRSGILVSSISDHFPTFISINLNLMKLPKPKFIMSTMSDLNSLDNLKTELDTLDFDIILNKDPFANPNTNYEKVQHIISSLIKKYFPLKRVRFNKYKHQDNNWITSGIMRSIKFKDKLYKRIKTTPTSNPLHQVLKQNLRVYQNILRTLIKNAKAKYYENVFNNNNKDIKKTWDVINSVIKGSKSNTTFPTYINVRNLLISDQKNIIEEMNSYFTSVGQNMAPESNRNYDGFSDFFSSTNNNKFYFKDVTENEVYKIINKFQSKETKDVDGLSTKILKKISPSLFRPITLIINQSLHTGIFPDKLKIAKIIPIYKGNDLNVNVISNYRPISILPCISKVFEKIVYVQLYDHFTRYNLFSTSQYGFRSEHSTDFALLETTNRIHEYLNDGLTPLAVYMDLSKAFDTINHDILLHKLEKYGISNVELSWFSDYLTNRFQYVFYNYNVSSLKRITTGVPQGSILGPLLFIIYINDLPSVTDINIIQYADDTCLLIPFKYTPDQNLLQRKSKDINEKLNVIFEWLSANSLSLNIGKTKCTLFHYKQKTIEVFPSIKIDNIQLNFVEHYKFLGIFVDDSLSWDFQINQISNRISKLNGLLSRLKNTFPKHVLNIIYNSLILSILNYGILCWGFGQCDRIKVLQKKAIRNVNNSPYNSHTLPICKQMNILLFDDLVDLACLKFFYKYKNKHVPKYFLLCDFIKSYHIQRPNLRNTRPAIFQNYITEAVNYRPLYYISRTIKVSSRKRLAIHLATILNNNHFPKCVIDKIDSHSIYGVSEYFKKFTLNNYNPICQVENCFVCI